MSFRPHKFGRYIIVDPIAVGGMAEIYRARLAAAKDGPDRVIIIKKVIANLSQNEEFVQMFEEEIKITVGLTHPHIIQIYDYGKVNDQYFMAMEYVEGKNLRQFVKRLADMKSMFSIDMSCHIISQVCHALAYAHSYKDRLTGKPLGIVHRDISPQNIMISYDGGVKLFDFGIAKAKSASEATRAGVIKGKPSYLSPEQINGEELDGRCDIFALAIVLWELLTAKRLFVADTDMGVLRLIQNAKIEPPSTFNPAVPQALNAIVLKGLTRDKNRRYQNGEEFQRDLHKFVYSFNPSFNPADLSYYAQELFKVEIRDDRDRLQKFLAMEPIADESGVESKENPSKPTTPQLSNKLAEGLVSTTDFNREMLESVISERGGTGKIKNESGIDMASSAQMPKPGRVSLADKKSPPPPSRRPGTPGSVPVVPGAVKSNANPDSLVIPPWSKPAVGSKGIRNGTRTSTGIQRPTNSHAASSSGMNRNVAVLFVIMLIGAGVLGKQYGLIPGFGSAESPRVANDPKSGDHQPASPPPVEAMAPMVDIKIVANENGYRAFDGAKRLPNENNTIKVRSKGALVLEFKKIGFQTEVVSLADKERPPYITLNFKAVPTGTVQFNTLPNAVVIFQLGNEEVFRGQTPISMSLPVGTYKVLIENSLIKHNSEMQLTIEQGKKVQVDKALQ